MKIETSDHLHYKIISVTGEVDLSNSSKLRKSILDELDQGHSVIVDFSELQYIDSSGMATLVEGLNHANSKNLTLTVAGANGAPLQVLELTRLNQVFTMVDSLSEIKE